MTQIKIQSSEQSNRCPGSHSWFIEELGLEFMLVGSCFSGRMLLGFLAKDLCIIQVSSMALRISVRVR